MNLKMNPSLAKLLDTASRGSLHGASDHEKNVRALVLSVIDVVPTLDAQELSGFMVIAQSAGSGTGLSFTRTALECRDEANRKRSRNESN